MRQFAIHIPLYKVSVAALLPRIKMTPPTRHTHARHDQAPGWRLLLLESAHPLCNVYIPRWYVNH